MLALRTSPFTRTTARQAKGRNYATQPITVAPPPKLASFEGEQLSQLKSKLAKINSDPAAKAALSKKIDAAKIRHKFLAQLWESFGTTAKGYPIPLEPKLDKNVSLMVLNCSRESADEFLYALRYYQAKLQEDPKFFEYHTLLRGKDKTAGEVITNAIADIPTKAVTAKKAIWQLIGGGHVEQIRSGEAYTTALPYVKFLKRKYNIELTTAHKLSPQELEHYTTRFKQAINNDNAKVTITTKEDPSILGGEIYSINGKVTDLSWKTQAEQTMAELDLKGAL